jgi:hypothetical protein
MNETQVAATNVGAEAQVEAGQTQETQQGAQAAPAATAADRKPASAHFSALAKKERLLVQEKQKIAQEKAEMQKQLEEVKKFNETRQKAKSNPLQILESLGLTYEDITNYVLNGNKPGPDALISEVDQKFENFRREQEEKEQKKLAADKEAADAQMAEVVAEFKQGVMDFLDDKKEQYELINLYGGQELVFTTIEKHFEDTQKIMSKEEAAQLVEEYLEGEFERATKESKKIQSKFGIKQQDQGQKAESATGGQASKTLSNNLASSAAPSLLPAKTEEDRIKRALAALGS